MKEWNKEPVVNGKFPYQISFNLIPHIDEFFENGYTQEYKMMQETQKIMGDESIAVSATCVRVPVIGGHSESVNIEFEKPFEESKRSARCWQRLRESSYRISRWRSIIQCPINAYKSPDLRRTHPP